MREPADFTHDQKDGGTLHFTGDLSLARIGDLPERLAAVQGKVARLDLTQVERIDTVGAWLIHRFAREHQAGIDGLDADEQHLLDQVAQAEHPLAQPPPISIEERIRQKKRERKRRERARRRA